MLRKHIRLQLARSKAFPNRSASHGYDLVAPLDRNGHIDIELWRRHREACRVRRFWEDEDAAVGISFTSREARSTPGGHSNYDAIADEDDEPGFRLGTHMFSPGEYLSTKDHGGELHTFIVTSVEAVEK